MAIETLTQPGVSLGSFVPPAQSTLSMHDQNNNAVSVFVSILNKGGANTLRFNQWGPSTAVIDSLTTTGNFNGFPTHFHMTFHGTGNITGHGNDDAYTGTLDCDLSYSGENGRWESIFKHGSASVTYTD
jgi:hypothetical protein